MTSPGSHQRPPVFFKEPDEFLDLHLKSIEERPECRPTDLELSGAARLPPREAGRGRPTRPLERLLKLLPARLRTW